MSDTSFRARVCTAAAIMLAAPSLWAQALAQFDLPSQPLAVSLRAVGSQTNTNVLFDPPLVEGLDAPALKAELTADRAFAQLLAGSGLRHRFLDDRTVMVISVATSTSHEQSHRSALRLAQAGTPAADREESSVLAAEAPRHTAAAPKPTPEVEEILVVGSRLGAAAVESAQPVRLLTRAEIERSGSTTLAQVLNTLPEVSISQSGTAAQNLYGGTTVQMRGLPTGNTLVLLNGRRMAAAAFVSSANSLDLGSVPLDLVERVEILPTGSSAVYGGDALGGVVNIVLRERIDGFGVSGRYGSADGIDETQSSFGWGQAWSRGSLSITGTYSKNGELRGTERDVTSNDDDRRFGGVDRRLNASRPGNVFSLNGANLPGLSSSFAAVPAGGSGVGLTPASFAATAGTLNRASLGSYTSHIPEQERYGTFAQGVFDLTQSTHLFTELMYSRTELLRKSLPLMRSVTVPASNPFNPFGVAVRADFLVGDRRVVDYEADTVRALAGARGKLFSWSWEIAGANTRNKERLDDTIGAIDTAALNAALASTNPATALNPFQDGPTGSPELIATFLTPRVTEYRSTVTEVTGFMRGPALDLPAGTVDALIGAEYERDHIAFPPATNQSFNEARDKRAFFGEAKVPLWDGDDGRDLLSLSGALRYDRYSDFGGKVSVGGGLEYRPMPSLLLRGSYSTAFKPPLLLHLFGAPTTTQATVTDPVLNQSYAVTRVSGGNPLLKPQTGSSDTFGVVYSPEEAGGLRLALTHWRVHLDDGFVTPDVQYIVSNAALFPGRVTRDPTTNRVTVVNGTRINFGYIDEAGVDFSANWRMSTPFGRLSPSLAVTNTYEYEMQAVPNAVPTNNVSVATSGGFAPRWKGTTALGWSYADAIELTLVGRYVSEYRDYRPLTDGSYRMLGDMWFCDMNLRYDLGRAFESLAADLPATTLSVGAVNLFDRLPEYSNFGVEAYDPTQSDLRGRFLYAQLTVKF